MTRPASPEVIGAGPGKGASPSGDRDASLRPQPPAASSRSGIPDAAAQRAAHCKRIADATVFKPPSDKWNIVYQAAGMSWDALNDWRPIGTAPYRKRVEVRVGDMTFLAMLVPEVSMDENEQSCDQWCAEIEGEHPPCWTGGACWASNEDEVMSLHPSAWRYSEPPVTP